MHPEGVPPEGDVVRALGAAAVCASLACGAICLLWRLACGAMDAATVSGAERRARARAARRAMRRAGRRIQGTWKKRGTLRWQKTMCV